MRNFIFLRLFVLSLFLATNTWLSAQMIITEKIIGEPNSQIQSQHNFDKQNYTQMLNTKEERIYVHNDVILQNTQHKNAISATVEFNYDPELYSLNALYVLNEETGYFNNFETPSSNSFEVNLPDEGEYDFITIFKTLNEGSARTYIIKELVAVQSGTSIQIDAAEANNYIRVDAKNEEGEIFRPKIILIPGTGSYSGGNSEVTVDQIFYFKPFNEYLFNTSYIWAGMIEGSPVPWNFHINNVSDRYYAMHNLIALGYNPDSGLDGKSYIYKSPTIKGFSQSHEFINEAEDWVNHKEKLHASELVGSSDAVYPGFHILNLVDDTTFGNWQYYLKIDDFNPMEGVELYLNNVETEDDPYNTVVFPGIVDTFKTVVPFFGDQPFFTKGNAIILDETGKINYGSGHAFYSMYFMGLEFYSTLKYNREKGLLPFNKRFTYSKEENPEIIQGNNVPVAVAALFNGKIKIQFKGRFGEVRESDFFNTQFTVEQDGNNVFSGDYISFRAFVLPTSGQVSLTLNNVNTAVDDIKGKSISKFTYDASTDVGLPTIQMLQFRDDSEKVTDRFENASDGNVRIAAGDFLYNATTNGMDYNEGNEIKFFYSIKGQDDWTELELTKYPEYFQMPAFGDYYEASLENVIVPENNSWFDVKVICTSASGNKQEQIISPAFKVEQATMGVTDVKNNNFVIYPNPVKDILKFSIEVSHIQITDMSGKVIKQLTASAKSVNVSGLAKGGYIITGTTKSGKMISKKFIKE